MKEKLSAKDSEHWRYVCLFLAGRIVRELGEDSEKILTQVCRPLDRPVEDKNHNQNHFLRPGAWFALEVVADGSLSKSQYRNFQYDLIDYGLEVLDTGLTDEQMSQLISYTEQLSQADKNDLLRKVLEAKFNGINFPENCSENALRIYGEYFPQENFLKEKIDALFESKKKSLILSAFNIALSYISDSPWIAKRLENYWSYWIDSKDIVIRFLSTDNYNELLRYLPLSQSKSEKLAEVIIEIWEYYFHHLEERTWDLEEVNWEYYSLAFKEGNWEYYSLAFEEPNWELREPQVLADQLIFLSKVLPKINDYRPREPFYKIKIDVESYKDILIKSRKTSYISEISSETIDSVTGLLKNDDLILPVKLTLWMFFWLFNQPEKQSIELFRNFLQDNSPLPDYFDRLWSILGLEYSWPLLILAIKRNTNQQDIFTDFLDYLDGYTQISIAEEIDKGVKEFLDKADDEEKQRFVIALLTSVGLDEFFPQLISTARKIGVQLYELVRAYTTCLLSVDFQLEYSSDQLRKILAIVEQAIQNREKPYIDLGVIFIVTWSYSLEAINYARQILELFLDKYSESYSFPPASLGINLFLKLLEHDADILDSAPNLFTKLSLYELIKVDIYEIYKLFIKPDKEYIYRFTSLLNYSNKSVRVGSALILKVIRDSSHRRIIKRELFSDVRIDFNLGIEFLHKEDAKDRLIGITLLSFPNYPLEEKQYQSLILNNLQNPKTEAEEEAWNKFLKEIPMDSEKHLMWRTFIEEILRKPAVYSSSVLRIAMERYLEIVGKS
ncbi:MAG: hypothetical protein F6K22_11850 [Okeania sp. SIO2F4]|uniref:hypothetical protein n=1 Tax=Okeania sp. SIO2F4 TaxID=2607790 RepID=UPI00142C17FE|nr:hypothetical protein [Okeania sp. SIO2F4]NES03476.1 hypothetical protein [Okeania sp. SIO2F4]